MPRSNSVVVEGELEFEFSGCVSCLKFDPLPSPPPVGLKVVDILVEEIDRILLIEVKDPCARKRSKKSHVARMKELITQNLIDDCLVPKCRDTYTILHLLAEDKLPLKLIAYIDDSCLPIDVELLAPLQDRLNRRVKVEGTLNWKRQYVERCVILTAGNWSSYFAGKKYKVRRI
jgi:hypothetical protein